MIKKYQNIINHFILVNLISLPVLIYAEEDRATKTISLKSSISAMVQEVETGTSLQKQADIFEQDLRKRYSHFSDSQVESMRSAYEDTIIENVTGAQIDAENVTEAQTDVKKRPSQVSLGSKTTSSKKNKQRLAEISKIVEGSQLSKDEKGSDEYKESKKTILLLTVKRGDTLSDIAQRNYGKPNMYIAIYDANKDKLKSPNAVPEGITLIVPVIDTDNQAKFQELLRKYEAKQKR